MRIACIHAHPDDAEILAGGTLALLAQLGHSVSIVTMTAGDCGSARLAREEISRIRLLEAGASAAVIGAEYRCAGFRDLAIFSDDSSRRIVTGLLRELRCELVLTAAPSDYHADHEATSQLVRDACFAASVPNYETPCQAPPLGSIPALYFVDPIDQRDREGNTSSADFLVDVTTTFETKALMLSKHESQRSWLRQQHGMDDYLLQMARWTKARGAGTGHDYGEGFKQYRTHPYPDAPILQDLLASFVAFSALSK